MTKDAYYFSHDSNARNDEKIVDLRFSYGWEGYGMYWAIIEMLRDTATYSMQLDCKRIAFALQVDEKVVKGVICDFDLFVVDGDVFYSDSLKRRMAYREKVSGERRKAARKRWDNAKADANAMQTECKSNALKEKKGERKEKGNNYSAEFEQFWSAYPKKTAKKAAHKAFKNAKDKPGPIDMVSIIEVHKRSQKWKDGFIPNPATWLNGGCWDDETQTSILPSTRQPELKDKF